MMLTLTEDASVATRCRVASDRRNSESQPSSSKIKVRRARRKASTNIQLGCPNQINWIFERSLNDGPTL